MCMINNYISMMWHHKSFTFSMVHSLWKINIIMFTSKFEENSSGSLSTNWSILLIITYVLIFRLPSGLTSKKFSPIVFLIYSCLPFYSLSSWNFIWNPWEYFFFHLGYILQPFYLLERLTKYIIHCFYLIHLYFIVFFYTQYHNNLIDPK